MGYRYDFRPIDDLLIGAGVDLLPAIKEKAANEIDLSISQVSQDAFSDLEDDYEKHAKKVNNPKYGQYLKLVDENIGLLKTSLISSNEREAIKNKLENLIDLDDENRKFQAKTFPKLSIFLHKLGQLLFKSHRFETKCEYGLHLVAELENADLKILQNELENLIFKRKLSSMPFDDFMEKVNGMEEAEFKELLKIYDKSLASSKPKHNMFKFYKKLSPEKKEMVSKLFENKNWYFSVFSILKEKGDEDIDEFISDNMIEHLKANTEPFFQVWSSQRYHNNDPVFEHFVELIILRTVRTCLKENDYRTIKVLTSDNEFGASVKMMLNNNLTQEEKNSIGALL